MLRLPFSLRIRLIKTLKNFKTSEKVREQNFETTSVSTISSRNIKIEGSNFKIKKVRKQKSTRRFLLKIKNINKIYKSKR